MKEMKVKKCVKKGERIEKENEKQKKTKNHRAIKLKETKNWCHCRYTIPGRINEQRLSENKK